MQVLSMLASLPIIRSLVKYRSIVTRVVVTIAMLAVIRSGLYIALPGVDLAAIPTAMPVREGEEDGNEKLWLFLLLVAVVHHVWTVRLKECRDWCV